MGTVLVDYWDPWNFDQRQPVAEYDPDGCVMLLAAVARQWWLDGKREPHLLYGLADWLDVDVSILHDDRPARFYAERRSIFCDY